MPFGKFKGYPVSDLPLDYLRWLAEHVKLRSPLREAVSIALREVGFADLASGPLRTAYLTLAKKWHPDHGGTKEAMQAINEFYEMIKSRVPF